MWHKSLDSEPSSPGYSDWLRDGHMTQASQLESFGDFLTKAMKENGLFLLRGYDSGAPATTDTIMQRKPV